MTVTISELDNFGDVTRQYYFFEGAGVTNEKTFTYQDSGTYQIVQVVGVDGIDDKTDTLFVEAKESIKPQMEFSKCSGNEIFLTSKDSFYDSVRIHWTMDSTIVLGFNQSASYTYLNSNSQVLELEGLFNNADEVCTSFFEEIAHLSSLVAPNISSAAIKQSCQNVYDLYLQLDKIDSAVNYRINLSQTSKVVLFDGYLDGASFLLSNIDFSKKEFCLEIEAYDPCSNTSVISSEFCGEPTNLSLSPFEALYSTYVEEGVYINLDSVQSGTFNVYRKLEEEDFEIRAAQTESFTDALGSIGRKYTYRLDYIDNCGQLLYMAETHPPFVDTEKIETNKYRVNFTPSENSLTEIPVDEYQSGNDFSRTEGEIEQREFIIQLDAKDGSPRQFISATSTYSDGTILLSNAKTVRYELVLYVPHAFTPNADGLNDTLEVFGLPTEVATTKIYNRWGQLIYTSDSPSPGWNGDINGSQAPEGTYLYEITFETADGDIKMQKGTFALIKN